MYNCTGQNYTDLSKYSLNSHVALYFYMQINMNCGEILERVGSNLYVYMSEAIIDHDFVFCF